MDIFFWIILGAIAGFLAHNIAPPGPGHKLFTDILGGFLGAVIGRVIITPFLGGLGPIALVFVFVTIIAGIVISRFLRI